MRRFLLATLMVALPFLAHAQPYGPQGGGGGGGNYPTSPQFQALHVTGATTTHGITDDLGINTPALNGWTTQFITSWNSITNPIVAAGTGYADGDSVTMSDGTVVGITAIGANGVVTGWVVSVPAGVNSIPAQPVTQTATTGTGTGLRLTLSYVPRNDYQNSETQVQGYNGSPMTATGVASYYGATTHDLGNTFYGNGTGGGSAWQNGGANEGEGGCTGIKSGGEFTGTGFQSLGCMVSGSWISAYGTGSAEHEWDGGSSDYYGTDSGKYAVHNNDVSAYGVNTAKFVERATRNAIHGDVTLVGNGLFSTVSGAANNGSGLIRLTVASTAGMTTNDCVWVNSVGGTVEANTGGNGVCWFINVVDGTHLDLLGSTFTHAYTSGGNVLDHTTGFINDAITGTANNGSGLIRVYLNDTFNIPVGTITGVSVVGVGGTTEANGTWTINNPWGSGCVSTVNGANACYVDLQGSAFTNAWTSGGRITFLVGPTDNTVFGSLTLGSSTLTGALGNVLALGSQVAKSATRMQSILVAGSLVGGTNLGNGGDNYDVILEGVDTTTDVVDNTVNQAVGIGRAVHLATKSVQIGENVGRTLTSAAKAIVAAGYNNGFKFSAAQNILSEGTQVGSTTCVSPNQVMLFGTDYHTDCATANETFAMHVGVGAGDIITATGTGTPLTSQLLFAGEVIAGGGAVHATNTTTGFLHMPYVAAAPTGTPATVDGNACIINTTGASSLPVLNCYVGTSWYHVAFTTGAG